MRCDLSTLPASATSSLRSVLRAGWHADPEVYPEFAEVVAGAVVAARSAGYSPEGLVVALKAIEREERLEPLTTTSDQVPRTSFHDWLVGACMAAWFGERGSPRRRLVPGLDEISP